MSLFDTYLLPRSGQYTSPEEEGTILPIPYGDLSENTPTGIGVCKLPLIDTVNDVYALAGSTIQSESSGNTFLLYDDTGLISSANYTIDTANDYQHQGVISTATFSTSPTGDVYGTYSGRVDNDDALITDPIVAIEDLLDLAGSSITLPATNEHAASLAKGVCQDQGYTMAGVLVTDQNLAFWINAILSSFLGNFWLNSENELVIQLDVSGVKQVAGRLRGQQTVLEARHSLWNICNQVKVSYARSWSQVDNRFTEGSRDEFFVVDDGETSKDTESQSDYGVQVREIALNFTRNTTTATAVSERLIQKFKDPHWILTRKSRDFKDIQIEAGDYCLFACEFLQDESSLSLVNQYGQCLKKSTDNDMFQDELQIFDTGTFMPETSPAWDGTQSVGDGTFFNGARDRTVI